MYKLPVPVSALFVCVKRIILFVQSTLKFEILKNVNIFESNSILYSYLLLSWSSCCGPNSVSWNMWFSATGGSP